MGSTRYCIVCDKFKLFELNRNINHSYCVDCGATQGLNPDNFVLKHFLRKIKKEDKSHLLIDVKNLNDMLLRQRKSISSLQKKYNKLLIKYNDR